MNPAIVISARDNVATALEPLEGGRMLRIGEAAVSIVEPIPRGHKFALRAIRAGEPVVKYGSPIGTAAADIAPGAHVHTHNLASARGRGDLARPVATSEARIAEPPDERLRPERGAGGERGEAAPPSESERGWGPASIKK